MKTHCNDLVLDLAGDDPSQLKPDISFLEPGSNPCCLACPLSAWSFTALTGLSPHVNRALNSWLAPGIVLGISHLLHRPSMNTLPQSKRERERQESAVRKRPPGGKYGVKQGWGRSPPRSLCSAGSVVSLSRGYKGRGRSGGISGSCYPTQMWKRAGTAPVWRCPKCGVTACLLLQKQELLFWEMPFHHNTTVYWSLFYSYKASAELCCYFYTSHWNTITIWNIFFSELLASLEEISKVWNVPWGTIEGASVCVSVDLRLCSVSERVYVQSKTFPVALRALRLLTRLSSPVKSDELGNEKQVCVKCVDHSSISLSLSLTPPSPCRPLRTARAELCFMTKGLRGSRENTGGARTILEDGQRTAATFALCFQSQIEHSGAVTLRRYLINISLAANHPPL